MTTSPGKEGTLSPDPRGDEDTAPGAFANTVGKLTIVNVVLLLCSFVSGPITARALGAEGRGELAAIVVVLTVGPWLLDIGMAQWVGRERARSGRLEDLLGAALPIVLAGSMISVVGAIPLAHAIGGDRVFVVTFLEIGFFCMPVSVVLYTLSGLAVGESRWNLYAAIRLVANALPVVVLVILLAAGALTVSTAAAAYLVSGLVGGLLALRLVRQVRHLSFSRRRSATALRFGSRVWLSTVAGSANLRLDQVLMAAIVTSRELGLYAVAVTISSAAFGLIQAVSAAVFPRIAEGDPNLAARACRVTALIVAVAAAVLAAVSPAMIPFVFGEEFHDSVPMVLILLVASIPLATTTVLSAALVAVNEPAATMRAELAALALTIPALIVFLPGSGGQAAALISVVACVVRVVIQLSAAQRAFELPARSFLVPRREDLRWLAGEARRIARVASARA